MFYFHIHILSLTFQTNLLISCDYMSCIYHCPNIIANALFIIFSSLKHLNISLYMELIHLNQEEWNCDILNITIMGFSAGGHLAAQYSNRYDCQEIREIFSNSRPVHRAVLGLPLSQYIISPRVLRRV